MRAKRKKVLVCQSNIRIKNVNFRKAKILKNFKACQLTNAMANVKNPSTQYQDTNQESIKKKLYRDKNKKTGIQIFVNIYKYIFKND